MTARYKVKQPKAIYGFTIVELLVVIVVIGILAAITIVSYTGITSRATASALQSDLTNASSQLKLYQIDHSAYPTSLNASNCPLDSSGVVDSTYCIKPTSGNTFLYSSNNNSTPQTFSLYAINTSTNTKYRTTDSSSPTVATPVVATGGTITNVGGYRIHTFTTGGTFTVTSGDNVEYLVVAGGGGGGSSGITYCGGGGAGGLLTGTLNITTGSKTVTVGAGGSPNNNGSNSVFDSITAIGGGAGRANAISSVGFSGGSGGGGTAPDGAGGLGISGQGNNGGLSSGVEINAGGGGGGAGSPGDFKGANNDTNSPLSGGAGVILDISGSAKWYAAGGSGAAYYWGNRKNDIGGGSQGIVPISPYNQWYVQDASIVNGTNNTGSGGGGGHLGSGIGGSSNGAGGSGGSGIVIIRYPN